MSDRIQLKRPSHTGDTQSPQSIFTPVKPSFTPTTQPTQAPPLGHDFSRISIQPKLTVSQPNDPYEREADRVADEVMRMSDPMMSGSGVLRSLGEGIDRKCATCEDEEKVQLKLGKSVLQHDVEEEEVQAKLIDAVLQRDVVEDEDEEPIQMKSMLQRSSSESLQAKNDLESRLSNSKGGGSPLPEEVRAFMEPRFRADFSQVRVHTGGEAIQMNQDLNAQAFAHKQDVYFGAGKAPRKDTLTAHELTHVVQQVGEVRSKSIQPQLLFQQTSGCISKASGGSKVHRKYEEKLLPKWGSAGGNGSKMDLNTFARLIIDGKPAGDNWDISGDNPAVFRAPKCTKNGEVQIHADGRWTQNNILVNDGGNGKVVVSTHFEVNEKGEVHFKTATESHSISGTAAQMTGAGIASDNPPNGGSLVAQVTINSTDSTSTGHSTGVSGGGKFTPGGVGIDVGVNKEVSTGTSTPSGNSFSRGYRVDLTVEKKETKSEAKIQPVYFKIGKHKIIGSKDKQNPKNIKDIHAFLQGLPGDVRKELEDGVGDRKAQIQVVAHASVTTPTNPDAGFNLELTEKRRDAVVRILQNFLGGGAKIKAKALGEIEAVSPGEADLERVADITVTWESDPCKTDSPKL